MPAIPVRSSQQILRWDAALIYNENESHSSTAMTTTSLPTLDTPGAADTVGAVLLNTLRQGARGTIVSLGTPRDEGERELLLRLIEIGFLPGETVRIVARAAGGREPVAVRLGGQSTFALRRREAELVRVQPAAPGAEA